MTKLLGLAAVLEAATGLALMIHPSLVAQLLIGDGVSGAGKGAEPGRRHRPARLGSGLLAGSRGGERHRRSAGALLTYSLLATLYLAYLGVVVHLTGMLLWPGVAVHAIWMLLLVAAWRHERQSPGGRSTS